MRDPKVVVVTGSRSLRDEKVVVEAFTRAIIRLHDDVPYLDGDLAHYLHGAAPGVDTIVADFLTSDTLATVEAVPAEWFRGKSAGFLRNQHMIDRADAVVAIWDGQSKGTAHTIGCAARRGIPVAVEVVTTVKP